jgi:hypothetical protein
VCAINFEKFLSCVHGKFDQQNKVLELYTIINYYYYVSNKVLLKDCDKDENVGVTGAVAASCLKRNF